jgi:outer membrane protein assembly factor BamB
MDRRRYLALCAAGLGSLAGCATDSREAVTDEPTATLGDASPSPDVPPLDGTWRSYQHDAANTGATDDPGPADDPVERWRRATTTGAPAASPAAVDGAFVVVTDTGVVYARDAADGAVRWTAPRTVTTAVAPVAAGETVVVADGRTLLGIGVDTGTDRWTTTLEESVIGLASAAGRVVATTPSGVRSFAPADGAAQWRRTTEEAVVTAPAVGDGTVAVGLAAGGVVAIDATTGRRRWGSSAETEPAFAPAAGNDRVYLAAGSRLIVFDAGSGDRRWDYRTDYPIASAPAVDGDGVYVASLDGDADPRTGTPPRDGDGTRTPAPTDTRWFAAELVALAPDGSERWHAEVTETYNFTSGPPDHLPLVLADDRLIVGLGGRLRAVDAATGDALWTATAGGVAPATTAGVVSTGVRGIDIEDGAVRWRFEAGGGVSPPAVVDNTVYVGSDDSYLYALAADTGAIEWAALTDGPVRATPAVEGDAVYVGTLEGTLYAFDRDDGSERWSVDVGGQVRSPVVRDGTVYVGNFSSAVTAVDAADGTEAWRTEAERTEGGQFVALEVAVDGESVYAGANGDLRAFDATDGSERWRATARERPVVQSPPVVGDEHVLVNMGESVRAFDPADGTERWTGATGGSNHPPVVRDGTVYAPGDGAVSAFDAADGTRRWRTGVGGDLALAAGEAAVYGRGHETPLLALDPSDGRELWRHGGFMATTPAAVADDYLFVGDETGAVRAVGPDPG